MTFKGAYNIPGISFDDNYNDFEIIFTTKKTWINRMVEIYL